MAYLTQEELERRFAKLAETNIEPIVVQPENEAFKKIERLVKVRDRSVFEVRSRLERDEFEPSDIDSAIDRALRIGYLDDRRFADVLVRSRLRQGKGLDGIIRELKGHAVDPWSVLPNFPDEYLKNAPSQADSAYALLCRKPPRAKNARQAAYAKLVRNGYPASVAAEATRKWFQTQAE